MQKLDAFLDAKTKALAVLDEGNKAKNVAYEIDNTKSATSEFINKFIAQKIKATTGSVGPIINAGTTFLTSAKQGIAGAFVSKFAPLSSLAGGLAGGLSGASGKYAFFFKTKKKYFSRINQIWSGKDHLSILFDLIISGK